jgi:predicted dehydrogenase
MSEMNSPKSTISRRSFLMGGAAAATALTMAPKTVLAKEKKRSPNDKLNIACIGAGGKGSSDITDAATDNIVAICDVDDEKYAALFDHCKENRPEALPMLEKAKRYKDYRIMLEENAGSIDAVTVSTPDHTHAPAAMMALKMKKHVWVQKPLTHTVHEARMLAAEAARQGVTTQMGNQGHASEDARLMNEWIWDGAIGNIHEVHCWSNRPIWPQGVEAPKAIPSVPPSLDWNLWLGPAAWRPYHPDLCHFVWRGWLDFGTGAIGDMGAHILDHPYWALNLGLPQFVHASSTELISSSYPLAEIITYHFPARSGHPEAESYGITPKIDFPPVKLVWYDGGLTPPRFLELEAGRKMGSGKGGVIFFGDKGILMCSEYGGSPRLIPETRMQEYTRPEKKIPRVKNHMQDWIESCKAGKKSFTDFSYSGPLTETMLLGCVAVRCKEANLLLEYDGANGKFVNYPEADAFLTKNYREGWTL